MKAWIDQKDLGQDFTISLDGRTINYTKADSGRVALLLPLAGNDGELVFSPSPGADNTERLNSNSVRWYRLTGAILERAR